jgi:hypothetical protein
VILFAASAQRHVSSFGETGGSRWVTPVLIALLSPKPVLPEVCALATRAQHRDELKIYARICINLCDKNVVF